MQIVCISFVALDGDAPAEEGLGQLPPAAAVLDVLRRAFGPYLQAGAIDQQWNGQTPLAAPSTGLHLVYVYGHAWIARGVPHAAWRAGDRSIIGDAATLLAGIWPVAGGEDVLLFFDCCHAAAFDPYLPADPRPRLLVFASGAEEKAIALLREQASRLSLALANEAAKAPKVLDLARAVSNAAERLADDGVVRGQTVGYSMHGPAVLLSRQAASPLVQREAAVARMRNALFAGGGVVASLVGLVSWWYWRHVLVEVDLAHLATIASNIRLVVQKQEPGTNGKHLVAEHAAGDASRIRIWAPADNLVLQVSANYADGAERALNLHVVMAPGFDMARKQLLFTLPPAAEVRAHPGMAYISPARWFHGRERAPRVNTYGYWIDLRPPTVARYEPIARRLLASGVLKSDNSFLLTWGMRDAAIDAIGLEQLRPLSKDLGDIFGIVAAADSSHVEAPGDIVVGAGALPCPDCPAPMTRLEAGAYCASRTMRLPTDLEWELAVRGVDGRDYPWGNRFDQTRANVPGLPDKGAAAPRVQPVDAYPGERSPFGLVDTVGNAGDWVINASGSYERVYMGATYRFNPEDATAFRLLPVIEADYLVREITARCVAMPVSHTQP